MDTVTHGIVGSLFSKAYFSERYGPVATFAATVGAMFPDIDVVQEIFSTDPLAVVRYHRGITHSWFGLPAFAVLLAWLTRWLARRLRVESPPWAVLALIYAVAIASHIILDGMTSFGTRMFTPFSQDRVAWDFLFIIDFTFTAIALAPQFAAWVHSAPIDNAPRRAAASWLFFSLGTLAVWGIARGISFPFHLRIVAVTVTIFAALFFLLHFTERGHPLRPSTWCRAGIYVLIAYGCLCGVAHAAALRRVREFANRNHIATERIGALPLPPSPLDWGGVIRSTTGVYASRFDLRDAQEPQFVFTPDSPQTSYTARAVGLPEVRLYWNFARFPVVRTHTEGDLHVVEFFDQRFMTRPSDAPQPFTYRVVLDDEGNVVEEGWQSSGGVLTRIQKMLPHRKTNEPGAGSRGTRGAKGSAQ